MPAFVLPAYLEPEQVRKAANSISAHREQPEARNLENQREEEGRSYDLRLSAPQDKQQPVYANISPQPTQKAHYRDSSDSQQIYRPQEEIYSQTGRRREELPAQQGQRYRAQPNGSARFIPAQRVPFEESYRRIFGENAVNFAKMKYQFTASTGRSYGGSPLTNGISRCGDL